jgi:predicted amidohydrolase YtcJ
MSATTVLTNGRIYTLDPSSPKATALAISNGKIVATGSDDAMRALMGSGAERINLEGRCVTPGLVDAHVHFQWFSINLQQIDLFEVPSLDEALRRIAEYGAGREASEWIRGRGWDHELWPGRTLPTASHLDSVAPHLPICLSHKSGHAAWANGLALRIAGIDSKTPDPPGGEIQRDEAGRPTGILTEEAIKLVTAYIPFPTLDELVAAMRRAQTVCWQEGLVGIHDFDGSACFQALQILHRNRELGLRFVKNIPVAHLEEAIGVGLRSDFGDDWLRIGGVKIFADGALGPRTATMIAPYEDAPDNYGIVVTDKEEMMEKASAASTHGLSVTVHAIGDRANHDVLDVYEAVRQEEQGRASSRRLRHRIEHVQLLHPDDLDRLAKLNVIASMQPIHATSDMEMADSYWGERARYSYAWRTMVDSGATLVFGTDAPVELIKPIPGIHAAVTRRRADGSPGPEGWYPEQKLTMAETIHAYSTAAAITSGQEATQGSITPGKFADLTIFDRDLFEIPADEVLDVTVAGTMVGGEFKYRTW